MSTARDAKLDALDTKLVDMAETLVDWLDENSGYTALQIYFLCGVLTGLIHTGWPDDPPPIYAELLTMLDRVGAATGPLIAAITLDEPLVVEVSCERQRKTRKKNVH